MKNKLSFSIPIPKSNNNLHRFKIVRKGLKQIVVGYNTSEYVSYIKEIEYIVDSIKPKEPILDFEIQFYVYFPDKRKRDLDNIPKAILDAFQKAGLIKDDCLCQKLTIQRMINDNKKGCIQVIINY